MSRRLLTLLVAFALPLAALACTGPEEKPDNYVDDMAREHKDDSPIKGVNGTLADEPTAELDTQEIVYANVAGQDIKGYLARPKGATGPLPAVIVIHEWWGLNDNVRLMTRHLAAEGYTALAIDLYNGQAAADPDQAKALMQKAMENLGDGVDNVQQAHGFLKDKQAASKTAVVGWCFGGAWSLRTALVLGPDLDAAVVYYGQLVTDKNELNGLEAPLLGIFGGADKGIPAEQVSAFGAATAELDKDVTIKVFDGAEHAFANPSGTHYKAAEAEEAWAMTRAFLAKHLAATQ